MNRETIRLMVKELFKHAHRDQCYNCRKVLRAMGLDPTKTWDETFSARDTSWIDKEVKNKQAKS